MFLLPVRSRLRSLQQGLLRLVYPTTCASCQQTILESKLPICLRCLQTLDHPSPTEVQAQVATLPQQTLTHVFALWYFDKDGPVQHLQHALKYGNRPTYGNLLGRNIGTRMQSVSLHTFDLIIPIPLHKHRLYERGYNQSTWLARGISTQLNTPLVDSLLVRIRSTRSQTKLSQQARWKNVAGAFDVRTPEQIQDRAVLLVDDVLTTGATATAAGAVLLKAGAKEVTLATLAFARS